ncbi:MAG: hypothetical protein ACT4N2_15555, partial [Hyphomicrobium sp.]
MIRIALLAGSLVLGSSLTALANSTDVRMDEQRDVIELGRRDGSITWREGIKLRKEQAAIAQRRAELLADGRLSKKERRELNARQDEAEAHIDGELSDGWRRLWC